MLEKLPDQLDRSLGRWRKLHQSARTSLSRATQRIESGTLAASSDEYKKLVRLQNQATRQLNLLVNDLGKRTSDLSESRRTTMARITLTNTGEGLGGVKVYDIRLAEADARARAEVSLTDARTHREIDEGVLCLVQRALSLLAPSASSK